MNYNYRLSIVVYFLIITVNFNAMQINILNKIEPINYIAYPRQVHFFSDNYLIINNKFGNTYKINLTTNTIDAVHIKNSIHWSDYSTIQSNDKHILTCINQNIKIIDAQTNKVLWKKIEDITIKSIAWDPLNTTLFVAYQYPLGRISVYNYNTKINKNINCISDIIIKHPKKEILCCVSNRSNIYFRSFPDLKLIPGTICLNEKLESCNFCQYNHDGSYLALGNEDKIIIINQNIKNSSNNNPYLYADAQKKECFKNISFHPHSPVLAVLYLHPQKTSLENNVTSRESIDYYNLKTLKLIETTRILKSNHSYNFAFSKNGFRTAIALEHQCVTMPVIFAIKEKCLFSLCILNAFALQHKIPTDIARFIVSSLLKNIT